MAERPLTASLASTFAALEDLVRRDADAKAHAEAQNRVAFLHLHVQSLQVAVRRLKAIDTLLQAIDPDFRLTALWPQTLVELRKTMPPSFRTPGSVIVAGHLDLLRLVEYTAASAILTQERGRQIVDHLVYHLAQRPNTSERAVGVSAADQQDDVLRAAVERVIDRLVTEGSHRDVRAICRSVGCEAFLPTGDIKDRHP